MDKHVEGESPFNERAALEELERFKNDIERYRQQRKAVGEEFEHFVKSFQAAPSRPSQAPVLPGSARPAATPPVEPARRVEAPVVPPPPATIPAVTARPVAAATDTVPVPAPDNAGADLPGDRARAESRPAPAKPAHERMSAERAHGKGGRPSPVVVFALLLLAAGVAAWVFWPHQIDDAATAPTTAVPAPAPQAPVAAPAQPAAPPAAPAPSDETVIITLSPVWLRVIADGVKVREDEFPAGTRIPVDAKKTLVIRTGNAGAVSLTLKGKDQGPLGAEGQVVTRSFTIPER